MHASTYSTENAGIYRNYARSHNLTLLYKLIHHSQYYNNIYIKRALRIDLKIYLNFFLFNWELFKRMVVYKVYNN